MGQTSANAKVPTVQSRQIPYTYSVWRLFVVYVDSLGVESASEWKSGLVIVPQPPHGTDLSSFLARQRHVHFPAGGSPLRMHAIASSDGSLVRMHTNGHLRQSLMLVIIDSRGPGKSWRGKVAAPP